MNFKDKPLLSICIPTYNRAQYLDSCLSSIYKQVNDDMNVEIIVSNNKSTDNTGNVIEKFIDRPKFRYFEQDENLGAVKNILKLVNEYASGEFCWIVGDDDFLLQGALPLVMDLIVSSSHCVDYYYASVKGIGLADYNSYDGVFDTSTLNLKLSQDQFAYEGVDSFEDLITPEYSIIFLGELMASIFRRKIWLQYKINGEGEYLETLNTTYPHSVVLANTFFGKRAMYIKTPLLICLDGAREWWDKLGYILIEQVKNLLDLYEEKGLSKKNLHKCHKAYVQMTFKPFIKFLLHPRSRYRDKINFFRYFAFLSTHPSLLMSYVLNVISSRGRGLIR